MSKFSEQTQQLLFKIEQNKYLLQVKAWFDGLNSRDQKFVTILSMLFAVALMFNWIWMPITNMEKKSIKSYESAIALHKYMKENAPAVGSGTSAASSDGSLLGMVNGVAKAKGIALKRFEPNGANGLRVWLDKVDFNKAIDWLETLEGTKNIQTEQINIEKVSSGIVNIRAVLKL